jgi:flagellar FliL protein
MAKDEAAPEVKPAKSKKMLIIIVAAILVVAIAAGAAAFLLTGNGKGKKGHDKKESVAHEKVEDAKTVMVPFEEKFTVNIQSGDGAAHYLQVPKLELEVVGEETAKLVEEKKSKLSDRISSLLRTRTMEQMLEPGSDVKLKEDLKKVVNETLEIRPGEVSKKGVKEVILPASFIVQ